MELKHGPFASVRPKKIKANNGNVDNGMVFYMENALKIKFEGFEDQEQGATDVDREAMKLKIYCLDQSLVQGRRRTRLKVLKIMFEEFESQGKASKWFTICSISKDYSREQFDCENG
ncbi:hypothetical protein M9H77_18630 [Catharanthus roseus]|uniref:Uncharacterized protein n=1 Tax=Catharanthus roseus TaxID=4058 RepID=A0ACC0B7Y8_CATRO|nr:hypothetical protein M9H77_18630 [Catharanthus roseus]